MLIAGENTVVSDADRKHGDAQLKKLDHLVVVDLFITETAELADVVLPATAWGETDGSCDYRPPAEEVSERYPIWLTTGRRLEAYHTRTQTGRASGIEYFLSEETLEVHPDDVRRLGLEDGCWVRMSSFRGSVEIKVEETTQSMPGDRVLQLQLQRRPGELPHRSRLRPVTETVGQGLSTPGGAAASCRSGEMPKPCRRRPLPKGGFTNFDRYGNTSSASIPIALDEAVRTGRLERGACSPACRPSGGRLTWGASLMRF